MTPSLKLREGSHLMVDLLTITLIPTIEPKLGDLDDVVPLSEYKFDRIPLAMVNQTPKK